MPRGTLYGYAIASDLPVDRLRTGPGPRGRIELRPATEPPLQEPGQLVQIVEDPPGGEIAFALARTRSGLIAWCPITGAHRLDVSRGRILSEPVTDPRVWRDRVVSSLIPSLLVEAGELLLHAAAVRTEAGAVVVCGPSGRGKSTLAAVLDALGMPMLAEDVVAVTVVEDVALVWPGPLDARVDARTNALLATGAGMPTHATVRGKRLRSAGDAHGADPVPVVAVVTLEAREPAPAVVRPLSAADAMAWVFPSVLRLEPSTWPAAYARTGELLRRVPCHRARLRDDLEAVADEAAELVAATTRVLERPRLTAA